MTLPCGTLTRIFLHVVVGLVFLGRQYLVDPVHIFWQCRPKCSKCICTYLFVHRHSHCQVRVKNVRKRIGPILNWSDENLHTFKKEVFRYFARRIMSNFTSLQSSHTLVHTTMYIEHKNSFVDLSHDLSRGCFWCVLYSQLYVCIYIVYSATSSYPNIFLDLWYYTILFVPCVKFFHCLFCPKVFRPSGPELRKQI